MENDQSLNFPSANAGLPSPVVKTGTVSAPGSTPLKSENQSESDLPGEVQIVQSEPELPSRLDEVAPKLDKAIEIAIPPSATQAVEPGAVKVTEKSAVNEGPVSASNTPENSVEPTDEKKLKLAEEAAVNLDKRRIYEAEVARWVENNKKNPEARKENQVESDEPLAPTSLDRSAAIPSDVESKYLRQGDRYFDKGNLDVSFEDKGSRLETKSNDEAVAQSMVRVAQARGWDEISVKGSEAFRREAWLEAEALGIKVKGYTPSDQDKAAALAKGSRDPELNAVSQDKEKAKAVSPGVGQAAPSAPEKADTPEKKMAQEFRNNSQEEVLKKHPDLASSYLAVAMLDKRAEADGLNEAQRAIVTKRVRENIAKSIEEGVIPKVTVKQEIEVKQERTAEAERSR